ncbi:MAG TPA: serine hydrolase domain-containing protein [Acidimicrobiia bacterium]|nr:serine hydrolase domain-containing protein [Acidimicrobiia bacterium]
MKRCLVNAFHVVVEKLDAAVHQERLLAGAIGLIAAGRVIGVTAIGVTRLGGPEVGPDTLFGVGSTKLLSGLAAVRLAERGVLRLDVPVVELVPGLAFDDADHGGRVTLRHVLTHSSGLPAAGCDWGPADAATGEILWRHLSDEGLVRDVAFSRPDSAEVQIYPRMRPTMRGSHEYPEPFTPYLENALHWLGTATKPRPPLDTCRESRKPRSDQHGVPICCVYTEFRHNGLTANCS